MTKLDANVTDTAEATRWTSMPVFVPAVTRPLSPHHRTALAAATVRAAVTAHERAVLAELDDTEERPSSR